MINGRVLFTEICCRHLLYLLLFTTGYAYSQEQHGIFKNASLGIQGYYGSFLTTKPKSVYIRDSYASFSEVYFQKQTTGRSDWEITHNCPQWGVAFLFGNTGSKKYIGKMYSLFAYINTPLVRTKNFTCSFRLGAGPGIVDNPYNIYTNPKNTIIGTRLNAFINLMIQNEVKISPKIYLNGGFAFTHLSNGGTTLPNLGLNTPSITAGIRYSFMKDEMTARKSLDSFTSKTTYHFSFTAGEKQIGVVGGPYNTIVVLQPEISRRFRCNHAYGIGVAVFINPGTAKDKKQIPTNNQQVPAIQTGVYGSYEHFFGRVSIPIQLGAYIYNKGDNPFIFQQIGLRCKINSHFNTELYISVYCLSFLAPAKNQVALKVVALLPRSIIQYLLLMKLY
jgi:hypothetical protein